MINGDKERSNVHYTASLRTRREDDRTIGHFNVMKPEEVVGSDEMAAIDLVTLLEKDTTGSLVGLWGFYKINGKGGRTGA